MTPERARELLREADTHRMGLTLSQSAVNAILAACAEQDRESRRAALTEAAAACIALLSDATWKEYASTHNFSCEQCAAAIERIRDKP